MKRNRVIAVIAAATSGLLTIALSALPAVAAPAAHQTTAPSQPSVAIAKTTVTKTSAVRNSAGVYVAKNAGTSVAGLGAFTLTQTRVVAANGNVTASAEVALSGNPSKAQLLAQGQAFAANETTMLAQLALASGQDAAGAASVWGNDVGNRVAQLKALATGGVSSATPSLAPALVSPSVASGCGGRTPISPLSTSYSGNEISINMGAYGCLDYAKGGDWYVAESATQSYETHSHTFYTYYPQKETMNHYHSPSGGNSYIDWSPYTATASISGCGTKTIGLTNTVTGGSYSSSEDYCDGRISPWTSNAGSRIYSGSRFDCTTGWLGICYTNADTWYGQHSESYLHSPPSASYSLSHSIAWGSVNQYDLL